MQDLSITQPFATFLSLALSSGQVPADWRQVVVAPLRLKGPLVEVCNDCPISLNSINCKVYETILRDAILEDLHK